MTNLRNVDFRLLECFDTLVREGNVTVAAERLRMSQGNMSNSLARLRELLGDPILVRTAHGMVPTERSMELRPRVQKLLVELGDLFETKGDAISEVRRTVKIACGDATALLVLGPVLSSMKVTAPNLQLEVCQVPNFRVRDPLADGSFDMAIGIYPDLAESLQITRLMSGRMVCIVNSESEYARSGISMNDYCAAPHGVLSLGVGLKATFELETDRVLAGLGRQRSIRLNSQHGTLILNAVARGNIIATVPMFVLLQHMEQGSLVALEPPFELPNLALSMVWHHRLKDDSVLRWIRENIRQHMRAFVDAEM